ncbi:MAG TPA: pilus assembly protein TadG-related protein, partial [Gammaproteobacteria bacterium]|nr:pilus assembly protein TadG-related protein [Gammaproteobacteria bacterium]
MIKKSQKKSPGQVLVIFAISLLALLFFVGLALDAGSLYVTYGHLKRAVDSAAIAAANEFKRGANSTAMGNTAFEVLSLMNTDMSSVNLLVYICDENNNDEIINNGVYDGIPDGKRDPHLATLAPVFYALCPNWLDDEAAKKLVWVEASQEAPLYFLSLLGFNNL